jgi:hypothetical protein
MILSKNTKLWGAIGYDSKDDLLRFTATPAKTSRMYDSFEIGFSNLTDASADLSIKWEQTRVEFTIQTEVDPIVMADIKKQVIDAQSTNPALLYQAANYYFTSNKDMNQAYTWIKQSTSSDPKYWTLHLQAKIEMSLGKKTEALESATKSKKLAEEGVQMKELQRNIIMQIAHTETILMHWGRRKEQRKFLRWFQIPENLRTILATLPKFPKKRIAFRFDTCYVWLCKYIDTRNPSLYDNTNNLVVHIENDPLREVFQIDLFHHCQVAALLKRFLIPI